MNWEKASKPNPNPELTTEQLDSFAVELHVGLLQSRSIDSVTIDGHRLVGVEHVGAITPDGQAYAVLVSESGATHLLSYNTTEDGPVAHMLITQPHAE
jgi:hypothetical protein